MLPPLYPHQSAAIDRALLHDGSLALYHDPGLGKTRTCLELFLHLRTKTPTLRLLVLCPLSILEPAWGEDVRKFTSLTWANLRRTDEVADVNGLNYEAAIRSQRRLVPLFETPLMLVLDESSRLRDPRSLTTKTCLALSERARYRLVLSGTPASNGLHELWAQMKVVEPQAVHHSFYAWRREYFHLARGKATMAALPPDRHAMQQLFRSGWQWSITCANQDRLLARLSSVCHWVKKADALELPAKTFTRRDVILSELEWRAYESMRKQLLVEFEHETITAELALTKLLRLRQLASGFLYGEQARHHTGGSRLAVLQETLEELGDQSVIIWCQFQEEIEQVAGILGEQAMTLYGKTKDREESLRRFGDSARYLVAHPRSAGHGLTLTQASTCVWYSLDWSLEAWSQANDRIHRIGQMQPCLYVHLMATGPQGQETIDERMWEVLQQKRTLQEAIDAVLGGRAASSHRDGDQAAVPAGVGVSSLR